MGTKAEIADWLGVSPRAIDKHLDAVVRDGTGFDVKASVRAIYAKSQAVAAGRGGAEAVADLTLERARLAHHQANLAEVKHQMQQGELVRAEDVERVWADHIRKVRSAILAVASRLGQVLGHLGPMELRVIDRELRDALAGLGEAETVEEAA